MPLSGKQYLVGLNVLVCAVGITLALFASRRGASSTVPDSIPPAQPVPSDALLPTGPLAQPATPGTPSLGWWQRVRTLLNHDHTLQVIQALGAVVTITLFAFGIYNYHATQDENRRQARLQAHLAAWQVIDVAQGQSADGGRIEALGVLNDDHISLAGLTAPRAHLVSIRLIGARLSDAILNETDLYGSNLSRSNLGGSNLNNANLNDATLDLAVLTGAHLHRAGLVGADLRGANLERADLGEADLQAAKLGLLSLSTGLVPGVQTKGTFPGLQTDLLNADLRGANLERADLSYANLLSANLGIASLRYAILSDSFLGGAKLVGADLTGADLTKAILSGADLTGAVLRGASGTTSAQLAQAKSLKGATMPDGSVHP